jgi:hypothetical protein
MLVELDDTVHGAANQAAELVLALAHLRLSAQTAQFSGSAGGENLKECLRSRLVRHGPQVKNRKMPENFAVEIEQRHTHIARRAQRPDIGIVAIDVEQIIGNMN